MNNVMKAQHFETQIAAAGHHVSAARFVVKLFGTLSNK
jgi:hypothetical protein